MYDLHSYLSPQILQPVGARVDGEDPERERRVEWRQELHRRLVPSAHRRRDAPAPGPGAAAAPRA